MIGIEQLEHLFGAGKLDCRPASKRRTPHAVSELAVSELAVSELAVSELAVSELAVSELAMPKLAVLVMSALTVFAVPEFTVLVMSELTVLSMSELAVLTVSELAVLTVSELAVLVVTALAVFVMSAAAGPIAMLGVVLVVLVIPWLVAWGSVVLSEGLVVLAMLAMMLPRLFLDLGRLGRLPLGRACVFLTQGRPNHRASQPGAKAQQ